MRRAVLVLLFAACGETDKTADCDLSTTASAATIQDRKIVGVAAPYVPDLALASRDGELEQSIAARRAAAWQIVEKVLQPVPLAEPKLSQNFPSQPALPAWHTWYARDDFERVFKKLYRDLGPAGRMARAPIDAAAGFLWNATAVDEVWPEQQYLDYLRLFKKAEQSMVARQATPTDIKNIGAARQAGTIMGGIFLKKFAAAKYPWAHVDIAGTAMVSTDIAEYIPKDATGFGVRLFVEFLKNFHSN